MKILIPQGNELIEEGDGHGHSTLFFISKKNPYPNPEELPSKIANGEVKAFVFKKVKCSVLQNHNISHCTRPKRRRPSSQCTRLLTWDSTSWRSTPAESPRPKARSTFHLWPPSCSRFVFKGCYESISNMFQGAAEGLRREGKPRVFVPEPARHPRDGSCPWGGEETVQVFLFTVFLFLNLAPHQIL